MENQNIMKIIKILIACIITFLITTPILPATTINDMNTGQKSSPTKIDYDPLIDLNLTLTISTIRALDTIDLLSNPDFYLKITIFNQRLIWDS